MNDKGFFYADYSVGKVTVASKTVDAGQYTVELLNKYYKDDTAARISVFRAKNWELEDMLSKGYLNPRLFVEAITVINNIFTALPKLKPFNLIDIDREKERIAKLFTYENAETLSEYFRRKGKVQNIKEEYIILADDKLRAMIGEMPRGGLMEQPWHRGRKEVEKSIKLTLKYNFVCDVTPEKNCILSMENPEKFSIYLNGNEIPQNLCGFYLDCAIKNIVLDRSLFVKGVNKLVLDCPQYDYFTNLEALYIRGAFGVDENSHMTALPEKLFCGNWCEQFLANYAGNVTYHTFVDNPGKTTLEVPAWRGTLLGVRIDDNEEKLLVTFPFEIEIPAGFHRLAITVYGHRRNALGPFYLNEKWPERTGPYQFKVYENPARQLVPCGLLLPPVIKPHAL